MQRIRVQKHAQKEERDVLPFHTWSTEVFNRNRVKIGHSCWQIVVVYRHTNHQPPYITVLKYQANLAILKNKYF